MPTPWTEKEIYFNISACFHADFPLLKEQRIQETEEIFAAFNCSINTPREDEYTTSTSNHWGYMVVTTYRRLLVGFWMDPDEDGVVYHKGEVDGGFLAKMVGVRSDYRRWFHPPYREGGLTEHDMTHRYTTERQLASIELVERSLFTVEDNGKEIKLAEFKFGDNSAVRYVVFSAKDGKAIYDLMQQAIQNRGKLSSTGKQTTDSSTNNDPIKQIELLAKLRDTGAITEDEFQAKKKDLLNKI